jgi:hypothetical protein
VPGWWDDIEAIATSTRGAGSCRRVLLMVSDLCGADEGTDSPNRGGRRGRRAPAVSGWHRTKGGLCRRCGELREGVATRSRPPRREEGTNTSNLLGEGAVVTAGDVETTAVGSGGELARWLRRSGLVKVRHHGRSLVWKVMAG